MEIRLKLGTDNRLCVYHSIDGLTSEEQSRAGVSPYFIMICAKVFPLTDRIHVSWTDTVTETKAHLRCISGLV